MPTCADCGKRIWRKYKALAWYDGTTLCPVCWFKRQRVRDLKVTGGRTGTMNTSRGPGLVMPISGGSPNWMIMSGAMWGGGLGATVTISKPEPPTPTRPIAPYMEELNLLLRDLRGALEKANGDGIHPQAVGSLGDRLQHFRDEQKRYESSVGLGQVALNAAERLFLELTEKVA